MSEAIACLLEAVGYPSGAAVCLLEAADYPSAAVVCLLEAVDYPSEDAACPFGVDGSHHLAAVAMQGWSQDAPFVHQLAAVEDYLAPL